MGDSGSSGFNALVGGLTCLAIWAGIVYECHGSLCGVLIGFATFGWIGMLGMVTVALSIREGGFWDWD